MDKKLRLNIFYNFVYQVVNLVFPLVTVPYISRTLGAENIGLYSFSSSITQYFIIFGSIGLTVYGSRQIAYTRDKPRDMSLVFWSIVIVKCITLGLSIVLYLILIINFKENRYLFFVQGLMIFSTILDITWLYSGIEDFKKIIFRNLIVKIIGITGIFLFVKESSQLIIYVWINIGIQIIGNLSMYLWLPKIVEFSLPSSKLIFSHLLPSLRLFLPQVATQVYLVLDKTLLGLFSNMEQVGFYNQTERLVKVVLVLVTSISTVVIPRMSYIYSNGEFVKMNSYLNKALVYVSFLTIPLSFGLAAISSEIVPWFFGAGFEPIKTLMPSLSGIIFIISVSNVIGSQYMLPADRIGGFTISLFMGAISNFILNLIWIPKYGAFGAVWATVIAEAVVSSIQFWIVKDKIEKKKYFLNVLQFMISSLIMAIIVKLIGHKMSPNMITNLLQSIVGGFAYFSCLIIFRNTVILQFLHSLCRQHRNFRHFQHSNFPD